MVVALQPAVTVVEIEVELSAIVAIVFADSFAE